MNALPLPIYEYNCVQYVLSGNASYINPVDNSTLAIVKNWCFTPTLSTVYIRTTAILQKTAEGICISEFQANSDKAYSIIDRISKKFFNLYNTSQELCSASYGQLEPCTMSPTDSSSHQAREYESTEWVYIGTGLGIIALCCLSTGVMLYKTYKNKKLSEVNQMMGAKREQTYSLVSTKDELMSDT